MAVTSSCSTTRSSATIYLLLVLSAVVVLRSGRVDAASTMASQMQHQDCDEEQLNRAKLRFKVKNVVVVG